MFANQTTTGHGYSMLAFLFLFLWTGKLRGIFSVALQEPSASDAVPSLFLDFAADFFETEQPSALKWSINLWHVHMLFSNYGTHYSVWFWACMRVSNTPTVMHHTHFELVSSKSFCRAVQSTEKSSRMSRSTKRWERILSFILWDMT